MRLGPCHAGKECASPALRPVKVVSALIAGTFSTTDRYSVDSRRADLHLDRTASPFATGTLSLRSPLGRGNQPFNSGRHNESISMNLESPPQDDQIKDEISKACRLLRREYGQTGFVRPRLKVYEKDERQRRCWIWECGYFKAVGDFHVTGDCLHRYGPLQALRNAGISTDD